MSGDNVIISLRDRLQIERDVDSLLEARSQDEFADRARGIAVRGDQVLAVILGRLDRSNPQMLGALGAIASFYPHREEILNKLREAAADPDRPDQERVSAMLISERFLGASPDPLLVETLGDPRAIVIESVKGMIRAAEHEPAVFLQYVRSLGEQPEETVLGVIDMLLEIGRERAVPALCLVVQLERDLLAELATVALGRMRYPETVLGLQSLLPVLPPARRPLAERSLLKLQLCGIEVSPLPPVDATWRALVSPIDGRGRQVVWLIQDADEGGGSRFVGVAIGPEGMDQAYGSHRMPAQLLPGQRGRGKVYAVSAPSATPRSDGPPYAARPGEQEPPKQRPEAPALYMLETDFEYGRRLVREAQERSFDLGRSLPPEYCLLSPLLWQYEDAGVEVRRRPPSGDGSLLDLLPELPGLLSHPAFAGWFVYGERVLELAMGVVKWTARPDQKGPRRWAVKVAEEYFDEAMTRQLQARLRVMEEWLWRAGEAHLAELAGVAAVAAVEMPPSQNPFTLRMAELGLDLVIYQLQKQLNRKQ